MENRPTAATWWTEFVEERVWGKLTPDGVDLLTHGVSPRWPADGEFDEHTLVLGIDVNLGDGAIKRIGDFLDATQESWPHDLWPVRHIEWEPWEGGKPPPIEVRKSDQGNAMRLVHQHGQDLLYCHPWKKWLIWDRRRWRVDDTAEVFRRAKETVQSIYAEAAEAADEKERKDLGLCLRERGFVPGRTGKARVWRGIGLLDVDTVTHRDTMTHSDASSNIFESVQPHIEKGENLRHDTSCVIDGDPDDPLAQAAVDWGGKVTNVEYIECEGEKVPF